MTKGSDFVHNTILPFAQKLGYQETTKTSSVQTPIEWYLTFKVFVK